MAGLQTPDAPVSPTPAWSVGDALRRMFVPPRGTPAVTRLRLLILVTAAAVVAVEALNLWLAPEAGYAMAVRTGWAALRVVGFLFLMRSVRFGRASARPFGLILAVTTVFAVARLTAPRNGDLLPRPEVIAGFVLLAALCGAVVWVLYRSTAIAEHFEHQPARRHLAPSVLTARVAVLTYGPLVLIPLLVGVGTLFEDKRPNPIPTTLVVLMGWAVVFIVLTVAVPLVSFFLLFGKTWARWLLGIISVIVLITQPLFCFAVLGWDGLVRDGVPLIVTVVIGLVALYHSRGVPTGHRLR